MNGNKHPYLLAILVGLLLITLPACQPGQAPVGTTAPAEQQNTMAIPALQAKLEAGEALRIMPMGGSIVEGFCDRPSQCNWPEEINTPLEGGGAEACSWSNNEANPRAVGFREFLHDKLIAEGVKVNYVGSVQEVQDLAHEGHLAFTIDDLDHCVQNAGWLERAQPDVILLLSGADDAGWGETPAEILASLEKLLGHIYEKLPETTEVIIAQYPPTRDEVYAGWKPDTTVNFKTILAEYNAGIPGVVEKLQADGKHVNYVNMDKVFQAADEYDESGFHPRAVAAERMAQAWLEKIMEILDKPVMVSASPTMQPLPTKQPPPPPTYYVDAPLRIMPLGDGFTEGSCDKPNNCVYPDNMTWPHDGGGVASCQTNATLGSPGIRGYREFLRDKLAAAGVNMTYVGSVDLVEGLAHEGHYAFFITDLDYCIQNAKWLEQAQPDMILIDAGATEIFFEHPAMDTIADLRILLTSIYQKLPETTEVILAQIHPVREGLHVVWDPEKPLVNDVLAEYNAMLPAVVEEFQAEGKHVSLIDTQKVVQSPEEFDEFGAQLSPVAQERQAQVWYEKIMEIVGQ